MTHPKEAARALRTRLADLGPRLGSATVLIAIAAVSWWVGSITFFVVWLIGALVVHFEWQRIVGGDNLDARLAVGTLALIAAAIAVRSQAPAFAALIVVAASLVAAFQAGPELRLWSGLGVAYGGALILADIDAAQLLSLRPLGHRLALCHRLGHRRLRLFRRSADRRSQIPAAYLAVQDLVGHCRRCSGRRCDRARLSCRRGTA